MHVRPAMASDLPALHPLIERAYRGDSARTGWTHEADLLADPRTDMESLAAIVRDPAQRLLVALDGAGIPIGCVNIADQGGGLSYLGLFCIEPRRQAAGLGRRLLAAAEDHAARLFGAKVMEMTVIDSRHELIAWYDRRGYFPTGEKRPFPIPLDPPYRMAVLAKPLAIRPDLG
ncbi:GNAT family N-acetyltransferase [Sphingobium cloacae]|uniref:Acetyltransferase n=2 Tax=Sphingobium cloacae TaxID=120107 RepID=A0A1E1F6R4_9SPHN|nr:GNAT family N-acetyltransferase [Sphingobium cloacae]BAV66216.1 acetyltransferase [Sphingobium cloacae]